MKILGHRFFDRAKDGGPESHVTGYWLVEIKGLCSIVLLRFADGSRDSYHSHAFDSWNWVLRGHVAERTLPVTNPGPHEIYAFGRDAPPVVTGDWTFERENHYRPSWRPVRTLRSTFHRVVSYGTTWVFSIRGPWAQTWQEFDPNTGERVTLTHGRAEVKS